MGVHARCGSGREYAQDDARLCFYLWDGLNFARQDIYRGSVSAEPGEVVLGEGRGALIGAPTEKYLPLYVRKVLRDFLAAQGFTNPHIVVVSSAGL